MFNTARVFIMEIAADLHFEAPFELIYGVESFEFMEANTSFIRCSFSED